MGLLAGAAIAQQAAHCQAEWWLEGSHTRVCNFQLEQQVIKRARTSWMRMGIKRTKTFLSGEFTSSGLLSALNPQRLQQRTVGQHGGRVAQLVEEGVGERLHGAVPLRGVVLQQLGHLHRPK